MGNGPWMKYTRLLHATLAMNGPATVTGDEASELIGVEGYTVENLTALLDNPRDK